jgi:hypothetical protein
VGALAACEIEDIYAPDWNTVWFGNYRGFAFQHLYTNMGGGYGQWIEVGYRHGWDESPHDQHLLIWAYYQGGAFVRRPITNIAPGPIGKVHEYAIYRVQSETGNWKYRVEIDGDCASATNDCYTYWAPDTKVTRALVGGETTDPDKDGMIAPTHVSKAQLCYSFPCDTWSGLLDAAAVTLHVDANVEPLQNFIAIRPFGSLRLTYGHSAHFHEHFDVNETQTGDCDTPPTDADPGNNWIMQSENYPTDNICLSDQGPPGQDRVSANLGNPLGVLQMWRDAEANPGQKNVIVEMSIWDNFDQTAGYVLAAWDQSPSQTFLAAGVNTALCGNNYIYFHNVGVGNYICSGVQRSLGFHRLRLYIRSNGSFAEIDGQQINQTTNTQLTPANFWRWGIYSDYGSTHISFWDNPAEYQCQAACP